MSREYQQTAYPADVGYMTGANPSTTSSDKVSFSMWLKVPVGLDIDPNTNIINILGINNSTDGGDNFRYSLAAADYGIAVYSALLINYTVTDPAYGYTNPTEFCVPHDGQWHNLVCTYDDATHTLKSYLDGSSVLTGVLVLPGGTIKSTTFDQVVIQGFSDGAGNNTLIAEVGVWTRILTTEDVEHLSTDRWVPSLIPNSLFGHYRLINDVAIEPNESGDGPDLNSIYTMPWRADHPADLVVPTEEESTPVVTTAAYGGANIPFSPDSTTADNPLKYRATTIQLANYDPDASYTQWLFQVVDEDEELHIVNRGYPRIITTPDDVGSIPEVIEGGLDSISIQIPNGKSLKVSARQPDSSITALQTWTTPVVVESQFHISSRDRALIRSGLPLLDHTAERISTGVRMTTSLR